MCVLRVCVCLCVLCVCVFRVCVCSVCVCLLIADVATCILFAQGKSLTQKGRGPLCAVLDQLIIREEDEIGWVCVGVCMCE